MQEKDVQLLANIGLNMFVLDEEGVRQVMPEVEARHFGPNIRIRYEHRPGNGTDLVVEERRRLGKMKLDTPGPVWPFPTYQWFERFRTNDMSNDLAHTEAERKAREFRRSLGEMENE